MSDADGVRGRRVMHRDNFGMLNEALWAPDASLVIISMGAAPESFSGGTVEILNLADGVRTARLPFAESLKWGP